MDPKELTAQDILKLEEEIKYFYQRRKTFLGFAFLCFGLGILFFVIGVMVGVSTNQGFMSIFTTLSAFGFTGFIVLLILRGSLYNRRIRNRKLLIKGAKEYREVIKTFNDHE
jgi:hypothetical protein